MELPVRAPADACAGPPGMQTDVLARGPRRAIVGGVDRAPASRRHRLVAIAALGVAAAIAAIAAVGLFAVGGGGGSDLNADPVEPPRDAPATRGTNYDGRAVAVPRDGRPAIVTFLFAECPDICPAIATTIRQALDRAGAAADGVDVVAVSVDPAGDTPAAVRAFLERRRMLGRMDYIVGSRAELEPLWDAWFVAAQPDGVPASAHSARVVLVDAEGRQAGAYSAGVPVPIEDLAEDIATLAAGG